MHKWTSFTLPTTKCVKAKKLARKKSHCKCLKCLCLWSFSCKKRYLRWDTAGKNNEHFHLYFMLCLVCSPKLSFHLKANKHSNLHNKANNSWTDSPFQLRSICSDLHSKLFFLKIHFSSYIEETTSALKVTNFPTFQKCDQRDLTPDFLQIISLISISFKHYARRQKSSVSTSMQLINEWIKPYI